MTGVNDANANLTFTYDSGGRQITAATSGVAGQPSVTLTSGFDAFGNRTSLYDSLSNTGRTTYSYDAAFRLTTIARDFFDKATTTTISGPQVIYGYDNANRLTSQSRTIGGSGTAVATSFSYDNANRLTTLTHQVTGGSALATILYGYDNGNRVTSEQNAEGTVTYGYDAANELTGASGSRAETYTYDSGGNRTMTGYSTGSGNELTASPGATYTYDNEGNMTAQANTSTHVVTSYTYDYHNRLTGVTVGGTAAATYVYDALGRRIGIDDNSTQTWTVYDGVNAYADFNSGGTLLTRYLYGPAVDEILARTSSGGTTAWYLTDRLGTVRDLAATSGAVIDHVVYDSFGNITSESNSGNGDRFKFAGMEYDSTTGQYYDHARWFGSVIGRFTSQDPKGFKGRDSNTYRYVANDVTNLVDTMGTTASEINYTTAQNGPGAPNNQKEALWFLVQASIDDISNLTQMLNTARNAYIEKNSLYRQHQTERKMIAILIKNTDIKQIEDAKMLRDLFNEHAKYKATYKLFVDAEETDMKLLQKAIYDEDVNLLKLLYKYITTPNPKKPVKTI